MTKPNDEEAAVDSLTLRITELEREVLYLEDKIAEMLEDCQQCPVCIPGARGWVVKLHGSSGDS